jgi:Holliday junction resolvase-like predicted endonuclease
MPILSSLIFYAFRWSARHGLRDDSETTTASPVNGATSNEKPQQKEQARHTGLRGETYGYWYLRRHGYIFVAKNYIPHAAKGELDLVGYDGKTLAFVEIRTRTIRDDTPALPELSVTTSKQAVLIRTATASSPTAASPPAPLALTSSPSTISPAVSPSSAFTKTRSALSSGIASPQ